MSKIGLNPSRSGFLYALLAVAIGLGLSLAEASYLHFGNRELAVLQVKLSSFVTSLAIVLVAMVTMLWIAERLPKSERSYLVGL